MPDISAATLAGVRAFARQLALAARPQRALFGDRVIWQIRLRWWVPPIIAAAVYAAPWLGFEVATLPILLTAGFILVANLVFYVGWRRARDTEGEGLHDRRNEFLQVATDYAAMFLLLFHTGGASSPLLFFFIFHVIFAAMLFRASTAFQFAAVAAGGTVLMSTALGLGWVAGNRVLYHGRPFDLLEFPGPVLVRLGFFSVSLFATAAATTAIMMRLRGRVVTLARAHQQVAELNDRLNSLHNMIKAVGAGSRLQPVLSVLAPELAAVMDAPVVTVNVLSEDRRSLVYLAAHGLAPSFTQDRAVELEKSPLSRRVIEEGTLVHGRLSAYDDLVGRDELLALGLKSVLLAPLTVEGRVTGILGAYSRREEQFDDPDTDFLRLTAELVAIAIEDARAYESLDELMRERSQFMLQVAHNMRAPLTASLSMLQVVRNGYLGPIGAEPMEYLDRVHHRLAAMDSTIGELLVLARNRQGGRALDRVVVDLSLLAEQLRRIFSERARDRGLRFEVRVANALPPVTGDPEMLEQMIENLVSNAIKYTPSGGNVVVTFSERSDNRVAVEVRDTGIGIPEAEKHRLFTEFFRASNAKKLEATGTGLGMALVKLTAERHGGSVTVDSVEGKGTDVTVLLPANPV